MSVVAPRGFSANGLHCGIKGGDAADLALVAVTGPGEPGGAAGPARAVPVAAMFTVNKASAAPVQVCRSHLDASGGRAAAVVLNSGCANAATGAAGLAAAERTCAAVAAALAVPPEHVLVCSTGLIGPHLPVARIEGAVPGLVGGLGSTRPHAGAAARAIMTTDTHPKEHVAEGPGFSVGGMAKGAGMIAPRLLAHRTPAPGGTAGGGAGSGPAQATMLVVLTTDADLSPEELGAVLEEAVAPSFNSLIVDGCTSTNDTVLLLASGAAGPADRDEVSVAVAHVCANLAMQLALDAEGTTRVTRIAVTGAASDADARLAARGVASSLLVKTSLFGADPYWGRILSELGASGAGFSLDSVTVAYGGTVVFAKGDAVAHDGGLVASHLKRRVVDVVCDLGLGAGSATVITTDLGHGYIDENMYTS